jgi:hypothetical protein
VLTINFGAIIENNNISAPESWFIRDSHTKQGLFKANKRAKISLAL